MTDEERQKYKEAKYKRDRDRYNKMTDEEKQKHTVLHFHCLQDL